MSRFAISLVKLATLAALSLLSSAHGAVVSAVFSSAATVPVTAASYTATGSTVDLSLSFAPPVGTRLTVVNNTGLAFIQGEFANLAQGQTVNLTFGGVTYAFMANYYGGTGNDLVLQWAHTRVLRWGFGTTKIPSAVDMTGVLLGKTVTAVAAGYFHNLALCSDGTVAAWGGNDSGQLGNNSKTNSTVPIAVDRTGVLAGKRVIAVAAGASHSLALCADGTLAAWGDNFSGQLGDGTHGGSTVPKLVTRTGVLVGKTVTAISAGNSFNLALCGDGTVVAWGGNDDGQLGDGSTTRRISPVLVNGTGALSGKQVSRVVCGEQHSVALCTDGTVAAWGAGGFAQLGNNVLANSSVPVLVDQSGVLAGKTVVEVEGGGYHCLARCGDGALAAWGSNSNGQLGIGNLSPGNSPAPLLVDQTGVLAGKTVTAVQSGNLHSLALCADGTMAAWGYNSDGELGNNSTAASATPVLVNATALKAGERVVAIGSGFYGNVAIAAMPLASSNANLARLTLSAGSLSPAFASGITSYTATVSHATATMTVTPTVADSAATVKVNGTAVTSGTASGPLPLAFGANVITAVVTAQDATIKTYTITVNRAIPSPFTFASATSIPITAAGFNATGSTMELALNFAPTPGTTLTVVNNTSNDFITGAFDNLAHGQMVALTYNGISYPFVANYYGGTGNDLVLQWANTRPFGWGFNTYGNLGDGTTAHKLVPVPVIQGALAGKTIIEMEAGRNSVLTLTADGALVAWGTNPGNGTDSATQPVLVSRSGVLAGKTAIAVAAGSLHSLVLCKDSTLAAWGDNSYGQLGNGTTNSSTTPVAVTLGGVLAGKTVAAVAGGDAHTLVLCTDGTLATWGRNNYGQLGNGTTTNSATPVLVNRSGVLSGRTVSQITCGSLFCLVLCTDGALVSWGYNSEGELGNGTTTQSNVPVLVTRTGVLNGKTVTAIAAGGSACAVVCSDGTVATWGFNAAGQLGNGSNTQSTVPVLVNRTGVLAGKSVIAVSCGDAHTTALCSNGTLTAWGGNLNGRIGNNSTTNTNLPVVVDTRNLTSGEVFAAADCGFGQTLALAASLPVPIATTLAATTVRNSTATLNGTAIANGSSAAVSFEYGLTTDYGTTIAASPATVTGSAATSVSANLVGLVPGATYHFRLVATSTSGTVKGDDLAFTTPSDNAKLAGLALASGVMVPEFAKDTTSYLATVPFATTSISVTPTTDHPGATVKINGTSVASGTASGSIELPVGNSTLTTLVTAEDGETTKTYLITVTRLPQAFVFNAATDVPVTANGFATGGYPAELTLNHAPVPGTVLRMVNNTGLGFITGTFANLSQGQRVTLAHAGNSYDFAVNYFGGTGNDLVLQWADTKVATWGSNSFGQLGDATTTQRLQPTLTEASGVLADKTVVAVAGGYLHSFALCADGTLAAWGYNLFGQLGDGNAIPSNVPVAVDQTGALAGKTVAAIAAGPFHNLALCTDGTVVAWGNNHYGQLGDGTTATRRVPVRVNPVGALTNKQVVAVAAAAYSSFGLCDDGTVAAWGYNDEGELGNSGSTTSLVPVAVTTSGALSGKRVTALAAGQYHTLALCTDGTLVSWGYNHRGQLGNDSTASSSQPVAIGSFGALAGKTPVSISAGAYHSLARCADGTVAAWGANNLGQLGMTGADSSPVPVAVSLAATTEIAAGGSHSLARNTDGILYAWGDNSDGQLGDNSMVSRANPAAVDFSAISTGTRIMAMASSSSARHHLALVALPVSTRKTVRQFSGNLTTADDLLSVAFGSDAGQFPQPQREGDDFVIRFVQPAGAVGIRYGAEWSATLLPGSWVEIPDTGTGNEHCFRLPAVEMPQCFMRLKVTAVAQ